MTGIQFKKADTAQEIEQIHRLNHQVFSVEVGQHPTTEDGRLIDRYHLQNRYFVAKSGDALIGMISVHDGPDFSIQSRLRDSSILGQMRAPLEVRLLAIVPEFRQRAILIGLFVEVWNYAVERRYSDLLISGIVERVPMYRKLGFRAMGEAVPCGSAAFVPMRLQLDPAPPEALVRSRLYEARRRKAVSAPHS